MKKIYMVILGFIFFIAATSFSPIDTTVATDLATISAEERMAEEQELNNLLSELYQTAGVFHQDMRQPTISIGSAEETFGIAQYNPAKNAIVVDAKTVRFAINNKSGREKTLLYLQVIGHELGHYIIQRTPDFMHQGASDDYNTVEQRKEAAADFYSVFTSMLAGYSDVKYKAKENIEGLYDYFELADISETHGTKAFRMEVAERVVGRADTLNHFFQMANFMMPFKNYQPAAIEIYENLVEIYGGAEFYNNLGVLYVLRGIEQNFGIKYQRSFFPLELELDSELRNVRSGKLDVAMIDKTFFIKATKTFEEAIKRAGEKESYFFNLVCAQILAEELGTAQTILDKKCTNNGYTKTLLQGLIFAASGQQDIAIETFKSLLNSSDEAIKQLAELNLSNLDNSPKKAEFSVQKSNFPNIEVAENCRLTDLLSTADAKLNKAANYRYVWKDSGADLGCFMAKADNRKLLFQSISDASLAELLNNEAVKLTGANFYFVENINDSNKDLVILGTDRKRRGMLVSHF